MGENMVKSRLFMVLAIAMVLLLGACNKDKEEEQDPAPEPEEQTVEIPELEEEEAEEVLQTYEEAYQNVVENAEEDGELTDFDSIEELHQEFLNIMSEELADDFIDTYFEENEESLIYIDNSEEPVWFDKEEAYEFEKVEDDSYEVKQEQEENKVIVTYSISWDDEKWIVSAVETEEIPSEESDASNDESESDTDVNQSEQEDNEAVNEETNDTTEEDESNDSTGSTAEEAEDNQVDSDSEGNNSNQGDSDGNGTSNDTDASEDDQNSAPAEDDGENAEEAAGSISESEAENLVKEYLSITDDDLNVVTDHQDENGNYVVQVYSVVGEGDSSHTSTYGWFIVNKETGEVEQMQ
ncbi:hypothetical protein [Oceanobacillus neutriphilus]|uniref:DUF5105 domain-containing protein n=1 Tax=Oceanobacillus neutriphilus TaxID=531815 RepID=A0ABQ2P2A0_9BACI|nr:hypothetical protein [Oceanobacillus neutriphilus]GGP16483.1 hypothetical protein GCM10011346_48630 [Oceanobacillus neutriphilus]